MHGLFCQLTATPEQKRLARDVMQFAINKYGERAEDELRQSLSDPRTRKARKSLRLAIEHLKRRQRSTIFVTVAS